MSALTSPPIASATVQVQPTSLSPGLRFGSQTSWQFFGFAAFLVSIPVFIQAPLVRQWPWLSLGLTLGWLGLGVLLNRKSTTTLYGDLILGFTWSWLAGSIYWGWFRWEPLIHLPLEAIGVPFAIWAIARQRYLIGAFFYLGSLWGTAITDGYFYLLQLIPHWRQIMQVDLQDALPILKIALAQVETPSGAFWAGVLVLVLCLSGLLPLANRAVQQGYRQGLHWWVFMGAVLSTLIVDGLFWLTLRLA